MIVLTFSQTRSIQFHLINMIRLILPLNSTHFAVLYSQNGDRNVTLYSVAAHRPMYNRVHTAVSLAACVHSAYLTSSSVTWQLIEVVIIVVAQLVLFSDALFLCVHVIFVSVISDENSHVLTCTWSS